MNRRDQILTAVRAIPALPPAAAGLIRLLQDPEAETGAVIRAIGHDASLTANVLGLANSALFGASRSIGSVQEAVVRLGRKRILGFVTALFAGPVVGREVRGYDLSAGELWAHSVGVALATDALAATLKKKAPDYAFTAGLLHDVGKIVLGTFIEVDAQPILDLAYRDRVPFDVAERCVLSMDHAEAGAEVLDRWNLPAELVEVVRRHHQPETVAGDRLAVDLVHTADVLCLNGGIGAGRDGLNYHGSAEAAMRLGLTTRIQETVLCQAMAGLAEARKMLG